MFQRLNIHTRDMYGRMYDVSTVVQDPHVPDRAAGAGRPGRRPHTRLFGSPEAVERILPLLAAMRQDSDFLAKAFARQQALGAVIGTADMRRMSAFKAGLADLNSAWLGLKLAIARTVGADVIAGFYRLSNLIAKNRFVLAEVARKSFDVARPRSSRSPRPASASPTT